jgi:hypothetical protein
VFSVDVPSWPALATALATCSGPFVLFVAFDVAGEPHSELTEVASRVLQRGATYVCCWGAGCELLHDAFDEVAAVRPRPPGPDGVVMTTWHDDESLEDALWFAVRAAFPSDSHLVPVVAASIGKPAYARRIRAYLDAGSPIPDEV